MSDLRSADDVAADLTRCKRTYIEGYTLTGRADPYEICSDHRRPWPCPQLVRVTELIEADREAAMRQAWSEGFSAGHNADHNPCWWPSNPYFKEDTE